jgi:hypothetical protein
MKFCQPHWDKLRTAIGSRGLGHLIAANGRDALARTVAELKGTAERDDYDPLMAAHWMIVSVVQERIGLALYFGDVCPVCEGIKTNEGVVDPKLGRVYTPDEEESYWIDGPADAVLGYCRANGLVEAAS